MSDESSDRYDPDDPRHVATARKLEAEARKLEAEAEAARAGLAMLTAGAAKAESEVHAAQIDLDRKRESRNEELAGNKYHHVYLFTDQVSSSSTKACMAQLSIWHRLDPKCPMEIVFSSPGGSVIDGMALFDYVQQMRADGHKVTTGSIGYAASMAGILLQAGDRRWLGRESYILIHEVSFGAGGKIGEVEDEVAFVKKIQNRVLDIFAARSKMSKSKIAARWRRKDWWLDSTEALKLGFVDEVR